MRQLFPSLYTEYFTRWPPIPTKEEIAVACNDVAVATAKVRGVEQNVSTYLIRPNDFHTNQMIIRKSIGGWTIIDVR